MQRMHMGRVVDSEVNIGVGHVRALLEQELHERLSEFQAQHRAMLAEARNDITVLEQQVKEQFSYNMEINARETRRDVAELAGRVESAQRIIEEGADLKRHLSDIDVTLDNLARRIEVVNNDGLARHAQSGGLKGRMDNLETLTHEMGTNLRAALDDIRNDLDKKASDADAQRLMNRVDQSLQQHKALNAGVTKLEAQMLDLKGLFTQVADLNDRVTSTIGEFENTTLAVSSELGEVKGKVENLHAKQAQVDVKSQELTRQVNHQMEELSASLSNKVDSRLNTQLAALEGKVAHKVDSVIAETKEWRQDNRNLIGNLDEKLGEHDGLLARLTEQLNGSVADRINQTQVELREIGRRVDHAVTERNDTQQDMRRELSQVQEVTTGLQEQYDSLLSDAAQRNEMWTDITRDMRSRMEAAETTLANWRVQMDNAVEDLRHSASTMLAEQISTTMSSVETLNNERERVRNSVQRLEEDSRVTAQALADLDESVNRELKEIREQHGSVSRDVLGFKTRLDTVNSQVQNDSVRMAKAVLDVDNTLQQHVREIKDGNNQRDGEIADARRHLDLVLTSKIPALETKVQNEMAASRQIGGILSDMSLMKEQIENRLLRTDFEDLQTELRGIAISQKEVKGASDRLDMITRSIQSGLEEVRAQLNQSVMDLQNTHVELNTGITSCFSKFDPALQRVNAQLTQLQRSCKDLQTADEKFQQSVADIQQQQMEMHSTLSTANARLDVVTNKPVATEQSLKGLQAQVESNITTLQRDLKSMQSHFQELFDRSVGDTNAKTKVTSSAVIELRQKLDTVEAQFREHESLTHSSFESVRGSHEEQYDSLTRKVDTLVNDGKNLKSANQKFEVQLNDTKALGRQMGDLHDKFNSTMEELRTSTSGIASELSNFRVRLERTEKNVRDNLSKDLAALTERVDSKFTVIDDRANKHWNEVTGQLKTLDKSVEDTSKKAEEDRSQWRHTMGQIVTRLEANEQFSQFGTRSVAEIKEESERNEREYRELLRRNKDDVEKLLQTTLADYDRKLGKIFEHEQLAHSTKELGGRMIQELQGQMSDLSRNVSTDVNALFKLFDLTREEVVAVAEDSADQRMRLLQRKPPFKTIMQQVERVRTAPAAPPIAPAAPTGAAGYSAGVAGSIISSASSGHTKPAVGLDCKDTPNGIQIIAVKDGGPAALAGAQVGDYIVEIEECPVSTRNLYKNNIKRRSPNERVAHKLKRGDQLLDVTIMLGTARTRGAR
eukprot:NODE_9_length_3994_cov_18.136281_g4_i0.p1 GENE.NODE_9_length_3994_cov_18.136281_g4_i0~~NODE_9_length_3994_cov_18.136281_g4_i0.p1  ORF type:complete len:1240 (-),score=336.78 NODE_9_length_3994_cov_18.136281_g4_i0:32-3751(-)